MSSCYYSESNIPSPSLSFFISDGGFQTYFHCNWPDSVIPLFLSFSFLIVVKKGGKKVLLSLCVVIALEILASVTSAMSLRLY